MKRHRAPVACELFHHTTLTVVLDERVVLLGCSLRQRLEPVGVVGDTILCGPLLHAGSDNIGNLTIQTGTVVHHVDHLLKDILRQILVHLLTVEDFLNASPTT